MDYEENCYQAIFWLTQSSLQGSQIATEQLGECLKTGIGKLLYSEILTLIRSTVLLFLFLYFVVTDRCMQKFLHTFW